MIEWFIAFLIVAPAIMLASSRSSLLLDYAIIVLAFNRGLRRIVDYYVNGQFNPLSPISLTPLVVAALLLLPSLPYFAGLSKGARVPFLRLGMAIALGFAIGFILNRFAAVYSLAEWTAGVGAMAFAATQPVSSNVADRWIKTTGWCAMVVALYGWWQYYTIPPWDAMWLVQSGMIGYMGFPIPTEMTVFSTLNERGPCGGFLAWAVIPMVINRRWRNIGGWLSVALLLSCLILTETRTNLIIIVVIAVLYPALARGRGIGSLLVLAALIVGAATWGMQRLPGMEKMRDRFSAEAMTGEGSSLQGRLANYEYGFREVLSHPLGLGLGSSGMGQRAEGGSVQTLGDAGYVQMFAQFGWLGGILFYSALLRLWREISLRWKNGRMLLSIDYVDPFIPATRAILVGSVAYLFVGDIFAGFSLLWVFFGRALSPESDPQEHWSEVVSTEEDDHAAAEPHAA